MAKKGRPSKYSTCLRDRLCFLLISGASLREACTESGVTVPTVLNWAMDPGHDFFEHYARARKLRAELMLDEILEIADDSAKDLKKLENGNLVFDHENVQRSRLRIDTRKWAMARMYPKVYGERYAPSAKVVNSVVAMHRKRTEEEIDAFLERKHAVSRRLGLRED